MFEDDAIILPDDFQETSPQVEETAGMQDQESVSEEVGTNETEQTEGMTEEEKQAFLKIKYNKEELELDEERARELAQMGMNYPKLQEKLQALESDPRLSFVEELAREQGMEVNDYLDAVKQFREQERINELVQQGISEELAQEMLENKKFREQFESEKKAKQEEEKKNAEFNEFFEAFRQFNGRDFVPNQDQIPPEVWQANQNGTPLKYAFMEHQMKELQSQVQVLKQNKQNEQKAPVGSLSAHGSNDVASEDPFLMGFDSI